MELSQRWRDSASPAKKHQITVGGDQNVLQAKRQKTAPDQVESALTAKRSGTTTSQLRMVFPAKSIIAAISLLQSAGQARSPNPTMAREAREKQGDAFPQLTIIQWMKRMASPAKRPNLVGHAHPSLGVQGLQGPEAQRRVRHITVPHLSVMLVSMGKACLRECPTDLLDFVTLATLLYQLIWIWEPLTLQGVREELHGCWD